MAKNEAIISPEMLQWAINRAGLSIKKLHKKTSKWLSGEAKPTFKQATSIAKKLQIPFGYLYLKSPPQEQEIIPDLRTIDNIAKKEPSLLLKTIIADMSVKQEWYKDYIKNTDYHIDKVVGRFQINDNKDLVCKDIEKNLNLKDLIGKRQKKEYMLNQLIQRIENLGILVMRDSILRGNTKAPLSLEEFRGFTIYDDLAPLIFINTRDSKAGQIFTLLHEIAHLWIGQGGLSDVKYNSNNKIELYCNEIAANILMPIDMISAEFKNAGDEWLNDLSNIFSVSTFSVLNRLRTLEILDYKDYKEFYDEELENFNNTKKLKKPSGMPSIQVMAKIKNGSLLSFAVVTAVLEGKETYSDGAKLLGYKNTDIISKISKEVGLNAY